MSLIPLEIGVENNILRNKSIKITNFDKDLKKFEKNMIDTLLSKPGVGLAAPQVGKNIDMFICIVDQEKNKMITFCNPVITSFSQTTDFGEEGCLSLPGVWADVERSLKITVSFQDISGNQKSLSFSGFTSRIIQHELDHLNGILFIDRVEGQISIEIDSPVKDDFIS